MKQPAGPTVRELDFVTDADPTVINQSLQYWRSMASMLSNIFGREIAPPPHIGEAIKGFDLKFPIKCHLNSEATQMLGHDPNLAQSFQDPHQNLSHIIAPQALWEDCSKADMLYHELGHLAAGEKYGPLFISPIQVENNMMSPQGMQNLQLLKICHVLADLWANDEMETTDRVSIEKNLADRLRNILLYANDGQLANLLQSPQHTTTLMMALAEVDRYDMPSEFNDVRQGIYDHLLQIVPERTLASYLGMQKKITEAPRLTGDIDADLAVYSDLMDYMAKLVAGKNVGIRVVATRDDTVPHAWMVETI